MKSYERLEAALAPLEIPVKYMEYSGIANVYAVYNEEAEQPTDYGDNHPLEHVTWWQVHIFAPKKSKIRECKEYAIQLLDAAGFTITEVRTLYEKETKTIHIVIAAHVTESEE